MHRLSQLIALMASLLIAACGAEATSQPPEPSPEPLLLENDTVDCSDTAVDARLCEGLDRTFHGVLPYGESPPGAANKSTWAIFNGSEVHIPDFYGTYAATGSNRCGNQQSTWSADCQLQQDRTDKICFDSFHCEEVNDNLGYEIADAIGALFGIAANQVGWDLTWVSCGNGETLKVKCTDSSDANPWYGVHANAISHCWNLPGKNICWKSPNHAVHIDLQRIIADYGAAFWGRNATYNFTLHELLHAVGLGHDANSIMNSFPSAADQNGRRAPSSEHIWALKNFNRDTDPCKWQPGDPLGLACPHEGPY